MKNMFLCLMILIITIDATYFPFILLYQVHLQYTYGAWWYGQFLSICNAPLMLNPSQHITLCDEYLRESGFMMNTS